MFLKASSESRNVLEKGYQPAVKDRGGCFSVCSAAERAVKDKLRLWLKVCLVYFREVRCSASQCDLLEGDLRVFVYTAVVHQGKVGHLGQYSVVGYCIMYSVWSELVWE